MLIAFTRLGWFHFPPTPILKQCKQVTRFNHHPLHQRAAAPHTPPLRSWSPQWFPFDKFPSAPQHVLCPSPALGLSRDAGREGMGMYVGRNQLGGSALPTSGALYTSEQPTSPSRMRRVGDEMVAPTAPQLTPEPGTPTALVLHASTDKMGENGE